MVSQYYNVILFALIALYSCAFTEARSWSSADSPLTSTDNGNPFANSPAIGNNILDTIFQSRGTSLDQLLESFSTANGDVGSAVSQINSGLNLDVLKIDENLLKFDPENIKQLLRESLGSLVNDGLANNPKLASILGSGINEQLDSQSQQITDALENIALPVETAQELLQNDVQNRKRRSLQPREGLDLGSIIGDIVVSVLHDQLSSVVVNLLESVKNWLLQFYTSTPPANEIESVIVFATNTVIQKAVEIVTVLQQSIQASAATTEAATPAARRKRQAEVETGAETVSEGETGSGGTGSEGETGVGDGTVGTEAGGLLDFIVRPILNILGNFLSPVNSLVRTVIAVVVDLLRPILGNAILDPLGNVIYAIVDLLLPTNQV